MKYLLVEGAITTKKSHLRAPILHEKVKKGETQEKHYLNA